MEFAIVVLLITAGVIFYIVRPGSKHVDPSTPVNRPTSEVTAPSAKEFDLAELESMTKAELMNLAAVRDVHAAKSWNKDRIISALTAEH